MLTGKLIFCTADESVSIDHDITEEENCNLVSEMMDSTETVVYEYLEDGDYNVDEIEILINYSADGRYSVTAINDEDAIIGTGTLLIKE